MNSNLNTLILLMVIGTSIWVLVDAHTIGIKKKQTKEFFNLGATGWFFACLLLWIIAFPAYIAKRNAYKKAASHGIQQSAELLSEQIPHSTDKKSSTKKSLGIFALIIGCGIIVGICWIFWLQTSLDVNGLPKCDSNLAEDTAKNAMANSALNKIINLQILSFEKAEYNKPVVANDKQAFCKADVLTNIGRQTIYYTISKTADGNYYVETSPINNLPDDLAQNVGTNETNTGTVDNINRQELVWGACGANSHTAEGNIGDDLRKRESRFYCDSAAIVFFDSPGHVMVGFSESKSNHSPPIAFAGLMDNDGLNMNVLNVYLQPGQATPVSEGICKFFFNGKHMSGIMCAAKVDKDGRRNVAVIAFDANPGQ